MWVLEKPSLTGALTGRVWGAEPGSLLGSCWVGGAGPQEVLVWGSSIRGVLRQNNPDAHREGETEVENPVGQARGPCRWEAGLGPGPFSLKQSALPHPPGGPQSPSESRKEGGIAKQHRLGCLNTDVHFLMALEARSPRSRCSQGFFFPTEACGGLPLDLCVS